MFAEMLGQLTCVDAVNSGYFFFLEPLGKGAVCLPVGVIEGIILSHDGLAMDVVAFVILTDVVFLAAWRDAVISENRIGSYQYLTFV